MKNEVGKAIKETTVFGEKVKKEREHGGNGVMGVLLVYIGIVLLAVSSGVLPYGVWEIIGPYWPVLLILSGVHIIIGRNIISNILMTILAIVVFGSIVVTGIREVRPELIYQMGLDKLPWYNYLDYLKLY